MRDQRTWWLDSGRVCGTWLTGLVMGVCLAVATLVCRWVLESLVHRIRDLVWVEVAAANWRRPLQEDLLLAALRKTKNKRMAEAWLSEARDELAEHHNLDAFNVVEWQREPSKDQGPPPDRLVNLAIFFNKFQLGCIGVLHQLAIPADEAVAYETVVAVAAAPISNIFPRDKEEPTTVKRISRKPDSRRPSKAKPRAAEDGAKSIPVRDEAEAKSCDIYSATETGQAKTGYNESTDGVLAAKSTTEFQNKTCEFGSTTKARSTTAVTRLKSTTVDASSNLKSVDVTKKPPAKKMAAKPKTLPSPEPRTVVESMQSVLSQESH